MRKAAATDAASATPTPARLSRPRDQHHPGPARGRVRRGRRRAPVARRAELAATREPPPACSATPAPRQLRHQPATTLDAHPHTPRPRTACGTCSITSGALPPRDEALSPRRTLTRPSLLEAIEPPRTGGWSRPHATWQVIRRLRASAQRQPGAAPPPRGPATTSAPLRPCSASLRDRGITLGACGQAGVDQWLGTGT